MTITPYEYAFLTNSSYATPSRTEPNFGIPTPKGWNVLDISSYQNEKEGYFSVAFQKGNQIVIAHRGKDFYLGENIKDVSSSVAEAFEFARDIKNLFSVWVGNTPEQFAQVDQFNHKIISQMGANHEISFTGHSLGGVLAQLSAFSSDKHATIFESPGIKNMLKDKYNIEDVVFDVEIYNGAPNLINTIDHHIVKPKMLAIDYDIVGPKVLDFVKYTYEQHDMERIMSSFDHATGEPKIVVTDQDFQWPSGAPIAYSYYASYDANKDGWEKFMTNVWNNNIILGYKDEKPISLHDKFGNYNHFKEQFIRKELFSIQNNPFKILMDEVEDLISGRENLGNNELFLGLMEMKNILKGDLEIQDAIKLKDFGQVTLKYTWKIVMHKFWPEIKEKVNSIPDRIEKAIDKAEDKFDHFIHSIKSLFTHDDNNNPLIGTNNVTTDEL